VRYTLDLLEILGRLAPDGLDGGISTAPLSYKPWMPSPTHAAWDRLVSNVVRIAEAMVRLRRLAGTLVHLDIEPEPDCLIETSDELIEFYERRLLPDGAPRLAALLACGIPEAADHLREHVRLCLDCCHFAVEYEDPEAALARVQNAGIQVGRVQLSSALKVTFPEAGQESDALSGRLRRFADSTYLHQVIERRGADLRHVPDLGEALDGPPPLPGTEWRIHFHVPLFTADYDGLGSTQDYVRTVLGIARRARFARHFEIETYTWDVLPAGLKVDLVDSIGREYEWVLAEWDRARAPDP